MKLENVIAKAVPGPVQIWSPETELSQKVAPAGPPLITYWDEEGDCIGDLCTIHTEGKDHETLVATTLLVQHCYNKFSEALKLLREASEGLSDGADRFTNDPIATRINKFLELAEEVKDI